MFKDILEKTLQSKIEPLDVYIAWRTTFIVDTKDDNYELICSRVKQIINFTNDNIEHILDRVSWFISEYSLEQFLERSLDYVIGEIESSCSEV